MGKIVSINPPPKIREQRHICEVDMKHDVVIPDIHYDGIISNLSTGGIYFESNESMKQISGEDANRIFYSEDKRKYQRKIINKQIRLKNFNKICNGKIRDISRGGAFIETDSRFSIEKKIVLNLSREIANKNVKLTGWIVRRDNDGFGITFDRRSGSERRYDIDRRKGLDRRNSYKRNKNY